MCLNHHLLSERIADETRKRIDAAVKYNFQLLISVTRFKREEESECLEGLIDRQSDDILYNP